MGVPFFAGDCLDMGVVRARSCVLGSVNPVFFSVFPLLYLSVCGGGADARLAKRLVVFT